VPGLGGTPVSHSPRLKAEKVIGETPKVTSKDIPWGDGMCHLEDRNRHMPRARHDGGFDLPYFTTDGWRVAV
jgi:hypothetical protein